MSFDEEWASLKEAALARRRDAAQMQLNGVPAADTGSDGAGNAGGGYSVSKASINGSSHLLMEIAGLLYEGRMDGENATQARVPRAHDEVAAQVDTLARFAQDQYNDMVALLASLATKLQAAGSSYVTVDKGVQGRMDSILDCGTFVPPEKR